MDSFNVIHISIETWIAIDKQLNVEISVKIYVLKCNFFSYAEIYYWYILMYNTSNRGMTILQKT